MNKSATLTPPDLVFDLVDVMDEDNQDWLPLGEPEDQQLLMQPVATGGKISSWH